MKKFKNTTRLKEEKLRLKLRELELEKSLRKDWREIKEMAHTSSAADQEGKKGCDWLTSGLQLAANSITQSVFQKVEEKVEAGTAKGIDKVADYSSRLFTRKHRR